jgi:glucose-1-phosphate thymidylyltransferase
MKGVVLAGGSGSRLHPLTAAFSKQLLPVFDKPMVFYPLATLMLAGIREILVITTPNDEPLFRRLLGNGATWGIELSYDVQESPRGIAQAVSIAEDYLSGDSLALILGDNLFHGPGLGASLAELKDVSGAQIFAYEVADPREYAVVEFDPSGIARSLEEKPTQPRSRWAVPGLYFYDATVVDRVRNLSPSSRGELEITDLNLAYLSEGRLSVTALPRGTAWLDTGTFRGLLDAGNYVRVLEERQGLKVACLEEIAWRSGWIDRDEFLRAAERAPQGAPADYLRRLAEDPSAGL